MNGNSQRGLGKRQGLYQCQPFRQRLLELAGRGSGRRDDTVPNSLGNLFAEIAGQKKKTGVVAPKRFIQKIKQDWEQYRSYDEHQVPPPPSPTHTHSFPSRLQLPSLSGNCLLQALYAPLQVNTSSGAA